MAFNCDESVSVADFHLQTRSSRNQFISAANKSEPSPREDNDWLKIALIHTFPGPSARNAASVHTLHFVPVDRTR